MCGICGIYNYANDRLVDKILLKTMARSMHHRGPDDEGFYFDSHIGLGHQRLSIIDLSEAGRQPMTNEDGRLWVTFNGEIYNYLELRQELVGKGHKFRSHSDTEVVLHLYEEKGPECLNRLNGIFAFAIWDNKDKILFAARDHFGVKPFYYMIRNGTFYFASEIKAFLHANKIHPELSYDALSDYLTFQFCLGNKTLFKNVFKLLPGHCLQFNAEGEFKITKYWDLEFNIDTHHTEEYFEHQLLRLLEDSVRLQLRADVPVGAHLSGGLDSSTVACLASSLLDSSIHTFSGGFKDGPQYDETPYARLVAEKTRSNHHEVFPEENDFITAMPNLIYYMDEPVAGPGLFPQYFLSKLAAQHVKVVLGGQGGDEIFGGYMRYLVAYLEECIRGGIEGTQVDDRYVVDFASILPNLTQLQNYKPMLRYLWKDGLFEAAEKRYFRLIDRSEELHHLLSSDMQAEKSSYVPFDAYLAIFNDGDSPSFINKMTRFDMKTLLPSLLQVEDRTSMAVSLESRVPILDRRIAELVASMPPKIKFKGGRSKHIFRNVIQHVIPQEILNRKDKMGFPVPLNEWYRKDPVKSFVRETLLSRRSRTRGIFNHKTIEPLLDSERPYGRSIWGLLCLELWFQQFIDGDYRKL